MGEHFMTIASSPVMPPAARGWAAWCAQAREAARQAPHGARQASQDISQKQEDRHASAGN
jgi:hypothetical protein